MAASVASSASTVSATTAAVPRAWCARLRAVVSETWRGLRGKKTRPIRSAPASSAAASVSGVERPQILMRRSGVGVTRLAGALGCCSSARGCRRHARPRAIDGSTIVLAEICAVLRFRLFGLDLRQPFVRPPPPMTFAEAPTAPRRKSGQIRIHGPDDFEAMRKAGRLAAEVLDLLVPAVKPGVTTNELDKLVFDFCHGPRRLSGKPRLSRLSEVGLHLDQSRRVPRHSGRQAAAGRRHRQHRRHA